MTLGGHVALHSPQSDQVPQAQAASVAKIPLLQVEIIHISQAKIKINI